MMVRQSDELQETLSKYIDNLENGTEDLKLYNQLKHHSRVSPEFAELFQQAKIAQTIYYERAITIRQPRLLDDILREFDKVNKIDAIKGDIWDYLNSLIIKARTSWKEVLSQVEMDPKLSISITKKQMNLKRILPIKLARIAKNLNAESQVIKRLSYEWLMKSRDVGSLPVSYRYFSDSLITPFEKKEEKDTTKTAYQYLNELEEYLA